MDGGSKKTKIRSSMVHQTPTLITDLPETLIHHIISYLSLQDIARITVSSKTWRHLCCTTPYLTLNLDVQVAIASQKTNQRTTRFLNYLNFIERILFRRGMLQLDRFKLVSTARIGCEYRIETWIHHAIANCNVQELDLNLNYMQPNPQPNPNVPLMVLPRILFDHMSLKVLHLNMHSQSLQIPACVRFTNLQSLTLSWIKFVNDPLGSWMATQCPSIKILRIENCFGFTTLNVSNYSLETFVIVDPTFSTMHHIDISCHKLKTLQLSLASPFSAGNSFSLLAPELESFTWSGRVVCNSHLGSLTSLQTATINIACSPLTDYDWRVLYQFGTELFALLIHVNSLQLCTLSMQILAFLMKFEGLLPLSKIDHLKLGTHLLNSETRLIMFLLRRLPTLKTLVIREEISRHSPILPLNVHQSLEIEKYINMEFVHDLWNAEIRLLGSGADNIELVKFLFKSAKALKKLTLVYSSSNFALAKKVFREEVGLEIHQILNLNAFEKAVQRNTFFGFTKKTTLIVFFNDSSNPFKEDIPTNRGFQYIFGSFVKSELESAWLESGSCS